MRHLRQAYLLMRDVRILTDLLAWGQANGSVPHVFKWMGVHDGIHEYCPGWCPCDTFDFELEYDLELEAAA
jgi:hypothetical protein